MTNEAQEKGRAERWRWKETKAELEKYYVLFFSSVGMCSSQHCCSGRRGDDMRERWGGGPSAPLSIHCWRNDPTRRGPHPHSPLSLDQLQNKIPAYKKKWKEKIYRNWIYHVNIEHLRNCGFRTSFTILLCWSGTFQKRIYCSAVCQHQVSKLCILVQKMSLFTLPKWARSQHPAFFLVANI